MFEVWQMLNWEFCHWTSPLLLIGLMSLTDRSRGQETDHARVTQPAGSQMEVLNLPTFLSFRLTLKQQGCGGSMTPGAHYFLQMSLVLYSIYFPPPLSLMTVALCAISWLSRLTVNNDTLSLSNFQLDPTHAYHSIHKHSQWVMLPTLSSHWYCKSDDNGPDFSLCWHSVCEFDLGH